MLVRQHESIVLSFLTASNKPEIVEPNIQNDRDQAGNCSLGGQLQSLQKILPDPDFAHPTEAKPIAKPWQLRNRQLDSVAHIWPNPSDFELVKVYQSMRCMASLLQRFSHVLEPTHSMLHHSRSSCFPFLRYWRHPVIFRCS